MIFDFWLEQEVDFLAYVSFLDHSPRSDESRDGLEHVDMTSDNGQISSATPRNSHQDGGSTPGVTEEDQIRNRIARKFPTISKKRLEEDKASAEL